VVRFGSGERVEIVLGAPGDIVLNRFFVSSALSAYPTSPGVSASCARMRIVSRRKPGTDEERKGSDESRTMYSVVASSGSRSFQANAGTSPPRDVEPREHGGLAR
jgi:hypothetical protein